MIGLDNLTGPKPALVADDVLRVHRWRKAGATWDQVAAGVQVSTRTARRYAAAEVIEQSVAGWPLRFIVWHPGDRPQLLDESLRRRSSRREGGKR